MIADWTLSPTAVVNEYTLLSGVERGTTLHNKNTSHLWPDWDPCQHNQSLMIICDNIRNSICIYLPPKRKNILSLKNVVVVYRILNFSNNFKGKHNSRILATKVIPVSIYPTGTVKLCQGSNMVLGRLLSRFSPWTIKLISNKFRQNIVTLVD